MRQVVLNNIKAYERARHHIQIVIGKAHAAELDISFFKAIVRIPSDLVKFKTESKCPIIHVILASV